MISVNNLSVQFTGVDLFSNVTFNIGDHDRIGLVGKNGTGKSTLLKILCGQQQSEKGTIVVASGQTIGYLPQEMVPDNIGTVLDATLSAFNYINDLEKQQKSLEEEISNRTDYTSTEYIRLLEKHEHIISQLSVSDAPRRMQMAEKVLLGLGFLHEELDRPISTFSGGWQMRVELAKLLLQHPSFLLLDEPTNHLDILSIQWLETYLQDYPGAVVVVSHDRAFLDNTTNRTIEITAGRIYDYRCSYTDYVELMQQRRATQMSQLSAQQRQVAQIEAFIERFRYKATKSKQVQSRIKMLDKMERVEVDEVSTEAIHFVFPPAPHSGKIVVEAKNLGKRYDQKQVFDGVDMLLTAGQKVAFIGRNGEGKSTMAKIINGIITDYTGTLRLGTGVVIGYYAQNQAAMLDLSRTVFQTIDDVATGDIRPKIRNILGSFLFDSDDIEKKVSVLSGGEKARLALAKLLLTPCNLLILDEPTNHLDISSKDILKNALLQYSGTLILVSHDRDFLQGLTDELYEFREGKVHFYKGEISDFLGWKRVEQESRQSKKEEVSAVKSSSKQEYVRSKERERERRKRQNEVEKREQEVARLEEEIAKRDQMLAAGGVQEASFYEEYKSLKEQLEEKMSQWEEAMIELEKC